MTKPVVGISSASYFQRMMGEDFLVDIAKHGVYDAEIFLNTFSEYKPEYIDLLKQRVDETGVRIHSIHPMSTQFEPQLFSKHPRQKQDAFDLYESLLKAGKKLGADRYVMHGALDLHGMLHKYGADTLIPVLGELNELARSNQMELALENVSWCMFSSPTVGKQLVEKFGDSLHYTLDIKQCYRSGYTPDDYLNIIGPYLCNIHLSDIVNGPEPGTYRWRAPLDGIFEFEPFFEKLKFLGYKGPLIIEVYSNTYPELEDLHASYQKVSDLVSKVWGE